MLPSFPEIASIGVELEGGYCYKCRSKLEAEYGEGTPFQNRLHLEYGSDRSVRVKGILCRKHLEPNNDTQKEGEIRAWVVTEDLPLLFEFVDKLFRSEGFVQNKTCGNHLHVRFTHANREKLFESREGWATFREAYKKDFCRRMFLPLLNFKYSHRLATHWCDSSWESDLNIDSPPRHRQFVDQLGEPWSFEEDRNYYKRYKMINFRSLREPHATLEFRILPYFSDANEAKRSYLKLLTIINRIASQGI